MRTKIFFAALFLLCASVAPAQRVAPTQPQASGAQPQQQQDAGMMLANYIASIAQSVQSLNQMMAAFIEKSGAASGGTMTDKRQKIIAGLQELAAAEQRVIIF